jgi:hypothetical protein
MGGWREGLTTKTPRAPGFTKVIGGGGEPGTTNNVLGVS